MLLFDFNNVQYALSFELLSPKQRTHSCIYVIKYCLYIVFSNYKNCENVENDE